MNYEMAWNVFSTLLGLIGLTYLWLWLFRQQRIDRFRQEMFILRDKFFDDSANGMIDFNHPAYGVLRRTMNGFIRYAHRATTLDLLFLVVFCKDQLKADSVLDKQFEEAIADLPEINKQQMLEYRSQITKLATRHLLTLPGVIVVLVVAAISLTIAVIIKLARKKNGRLVIKTAFALLISLSLRGVWHYLAGKASKPLRYIQERLDYTAYVWGQ